MTNSPKGKSAFEAYYLQLFSTKKDFIQWLNLLQHKNKPILRFDPLVEATLKTLWQQAGLPWKTLSWYPYALQWPESILIGTKLPGYSESLFYPMNASSLLPVLALNIQPQDIVLDACAAPGGKALMIAQTPGFQGRLVANDTSMNRSQRLRKLFQQQHKPIEILHKQAATLYQHLTMRFDKILLDAPCSSEKHVYQSAQHLSQWMPNRIKQLQQRQLSLLSGLARLLKPRGMLVYATCAVNREENEEVISLFLKKHHRMFSLLSIDPNLPGEPGWQGEYPFALNLTGLRRIPLSHTLDPMFVAVLKKN